MTTLVLLAGAACGVLLSGFASAVETGSYCLNHVRLRVRAEHGEAGARRLDRLMHRHEDLVITLLLGNTLADYVASVCVTALLLRLAVPPAWADVYATALLTPVLLVLGGIVPKSWFRREADRWMYVLAGPLLWLVALARACGVVAVLRELARGLIRRLAPEQASPAGVLASRVYVQRLLHEGATRGGLSEFQRDTIARILRISGVRLGDVMVPRKRAALVHEDIAREDFLRIARMAHFSRYPVFRRDPRRVVGVVSVFDVLTDDRTRPVAELARPPLMLRASDSVPVALLRMRQAREVMAIVCDRSGDCLGLLTIKDLVEEIVGELEAW